MTLLEIVPTLEERKKWMLDHSDAFISLPGGFGTLDEAFEMVTRGQLGEHALPSGFLNLNGYYNSLQEQMKHFYRSGFLAKNHFDALIFESTLDALLLRLNGLFPANRF